MSQIELVDINNPNYPNYLNNGDNRDNYDFINYKKLEEQKRQTQQTLQKLKELQNLEILNPNDIINERINENINKTRTENNLNLNQNLQSEKQTIENKKINSFEFNINFEIVFQNKLETDYKITYYGIYNLKTEKIENFTNLDIIKEYIEKNITVKKEYSDVIEYQPPQDILLDGQQEDGEIEITINYKDIPLLNQTIMLYDYKYGTDKKEKENFIEKFIPTMKENYINCLAHIFTTMEFKEDKK